jgi:O-acetyl-ADP-ribose deacetylase (regulator of RNase III)
MKRLALFFLIPVSQGMNLDHQLRPLADALQKTHSALMGDTATVSQSMGESIATFPNGKRIKLVVGDITKQRVDAIVNAANEQLSYGGGVAGAIYQAAAPQSKLLQVLTHELNPIIEDNVRCPVGSACANIAVGGLRTYGIKYVIEAVGPICKTKGNPTQQEVELLKKTYTAIVSVVTDINNNFKKFNFLKNKIDDLVLKGNIQDPESDTIRTIAVPLISAAIFGCGEENVLSYAMQELVSLLKALPREALLEEVRLMIYVPGDSEKQQKLYKKAIQLMTQFA